MSVMALTDCNPLNFTDHHLIDSGSANSCFTPRKCTLLSNHISFAKEYHISNGMLHCSHSQSLSASLSVSLPAAPTALDLLATGLRGEASPSQLDVCGPVVVCSPSVSGSMVREAAAAAAALASASESQSNSSLVSADGAAFGAEGAGSATVAGRRGVSSTLEASQRSHSRLATSASCFFSLSTFAPGALSSSLPGTILTISLARVCISFPRSLAMLSLAA